MVAILCIYFDGYDFNFDGCDMDLDGYDIDGLWKWLQWSWFLENKMIVILIETFIVIVMILIHWDSLCRF